MTSENAVPDWTLRLQEQIEDLESQVSPESIAVADEQLDKLHQVVTEMEQIVNGKTAR